VVFRHVQHRIQHDEGAMKLQQNRDVVFWSVRIF